MRVGVLGAGAIGCYVGGMLATAGCEVTLVGRAALQQEAKGEIWLKTLAGPKTSISVEFETEPYVLSDCDTVLVCVKSADTLAAAQTLARVCCQDGQRVTVVSLQNGLHGVRTLRQFLSPQAGFSVLAGMVEFNVVWSDGPTFHQTTDGAVYIERLPDQPQVGLDLGLHLRDTLLEVRFSERMLEVQWSKLMVNLLNSVNASANVPTYDTLMGAGYREVWAAAIREALAALAAEGVRPVPLKGIPAWLFPYLLTLPTWAFRLVSRSAAQVERSALLSMAQDLRRGRHTEVDYLNGAVVELGAKVGVPTPVNAALVEVIKSVSPSSSAVDVDPVSRRMSEAELAAAVGVRYPVEGVRWYHVAFGVVVVWVSVLASLALSLRRRLPE